MGGQRRTLDVQGLECGNDVNGSIWNQTPERTTYTHLDPKTGELKHGGRGMWVV